MKPIFFNRELTDKVIAGEKTMTRRLPASQPAIRNNETGKWEQFDDGYTFEMKVDGYNLTWDYPVKVNYLPGDVLYLREAWKIVDSSDVKSELWIKFRDDEIIRCEFSVERFEKFKKFIGKRGWQSPYFMPLEAARNLLRITSVKVERIQEISSVDIEKEGVNVEGLHTRAEYEYAMFSVWESIYGNDLEKRWTANPVVIAYEFEAIKKPE